MQQIIDLLNAGPNDWVTSATPYLWTLQAAYRVLSLVLSLAGHTLYEDWSWS
jgi:hypothetical protein